MQLSFCTLTGVDERTDLGRLAELSNVYPMAEWGFLYSPKRQGEPGRYPSVDFIEQAMALLPLHVNVALHVCGDGVMDLLTDATSTASLLVDRVFERGGRVQLNFNQRRKPVSLAELECLVDTMPDARFILQYNEANRELVDQLFPFASQFSVLHDASGGNGAHPEQWPPRVPGFDTGYAGGLGSATLEKDLPLIAEAAGQARVWIDMESSLRRKDADDIDWFSLDECQACLTIARHWQMCAAMAEDRPAINLVDLSTIVASVPDDIRAQGWAVAVHNDYRLNGEEHTFWLFTRGDRCVKGEGRTDAEALNIVRQQLAVAA